jgi:predicted Zn-dependent peptidase
LVTVLIGFRGPAASDGDAEVMEGLTSLLAGSADSGGAGGRLGDALVPHGGIVLSVSADYVAQRNGGMVVVAVTGRSGDDVRLETAARSALRALSGPDAFRDGDAESARENLIGERVDADATAEGQAGRLALDAILGLSPEATGQASDEGAGSQAAITAAALSAAARRYLNADHCAVAVVGTPAS